MNESATVTFFFSPALRFSNFNEIFFSFEIGKVFEDFQDEITNQRKLFFLMN
jgi:hypothetical protein